MTSRESSFRRLESKCPFALSRRRYRSYDLSRASQSRAGSNFFVSNLVDVIEMPKSQRIRWTVVHSASSGPTTKNSGRSSPWSCDCLERRYSAAPTARSTAVAPRRAARGLQDSFPRGKSSTFRERERDASFVNRCFRDQATHCFKERETYKRHVIYLAGGF